MPSVWGLCLSQHRESSLQGRDAPRSGVGGSLQGEGGGGVPNSQMGVAETVGPLGVGATHPLHPHCADPTNSRTPEVRSPSPSWEEKGGRRAAGSPSSNGVDRGRRPPRTPRQPLGTKTGISGRGSLESGSRAAPGAPHHHSPTPEAPNLPPGRRQRPNPRCPPPRGACSPPPGSARPPAAPEPPHMVPGAESRVRAPPAAQAPPQPWPAGS